MKLINKISLFLIILLVIIVPIIVISLNYRTNKLIEENSAAAQNYSKTSAENKAKLEKEYNKISKEIPGIVCIGSDQMASTNTVQTKLVNDLQSKLEKEGYKIPLVNLAVPQENTLTILGRLGVIPFVVDETVTIPSKADLIDIKIKSSEDGYVWPLAVGSDNSHINPVTIGDMTGMIGGDSVRDPKTGENKHYFVRSEDGEPFTIPAGSIINTSCDDEYKDYVHIIWIGENDEWSYYDDLADYIEEIIDSCGKNKNRYLVLGLIKGNGEAMADYDELMNERFGSHYLNVRKFLSGYDLSKTNISFNNNDKEQQKQGIVPKCMLQNNGNLNDDAYKLLVDYVYDGLIANDCIRKPIS